MRIHAAPHVVLSSNSLHVSCHENTCRGTLESCAKFRQSWADFFCVRLHNQGAHLLLHILRTGKQGHLHSSSGLLAVRTAQKECSAARTRRGPRMAQHLQAACGSTTGRGCRGKGWEGSYALTVIMGTGDWRHDRGILAVNQEILCDPQPRPLPNPIAKQERFIF